MRRFGYKLQRLGDSNLSVILMVGLLFLLLFVQSLKVSASEITWKWKVCGSNHIVYTSYPDGGVLIVDGKTVDRNLYCEVLRFYYEKDCFFEEFPDTSHCGLNLMRGKLERWSDFERGTPFKFVAIKMYWLCKFSG